MPVGGGGREADSVLHSTHSPPERQQLKTGLSLNTSFNSSSIYKTYFSKELKALPTSNLTVAGEAQLLYPS